jgi:hypothetical protein
MRKLMQEIRALPPHFTVSRSYLLAILPSFRVITGAMGTPGKPALGFSKPLVSLAEVSGIVHLLPIGQVSEMFQPYVNTYRLTCMGRWLELIFNREAGIPMGAVAHNANRLHPPTNRTVQFQFESADLRQSELVAQNGPTKLRIGEAVVSILTSKARVSWSVATLNTFKERFECLIYSMKHVLKGLAVHVAKVGAYLLALDKSGGLVRERDTLTRHAIGIPPVLESSVIQLPAQIQGMQEQALLSTGGVESVLVHASCAHSYHSNALTTFLGVMYFCLVRLGTPNGW